MSITSVSDLGPHKTVGKSADTYHRDVVTLPKDSTKFTNLGYKFCTFCKDITTLR